MITALSFVKSAGMYELFIGNKNYSSWSLRPWLLMKVLGIEFKETLMRFGDEPPWAAFRKMSGSGRVPMLKNGTDRAWDSLGIVEYLAERHPGVWPADPAARTWARCAAAEMHSGFAALREVASMTCGVRVKLTQRSAAFEADLQRLNIVWNEGLATFGGPFQPLASNGASHRPPSARLHASARVGCVHCAAGAVGFDTEGCVPLCVVHREPGEVSRSTKSWVNGGLWCESRGGTLEL